MHRYGWLQVLRAVAANLVVFNHAIGLQARFIPEWAHLTDLLDFIGQSGVQCFFVISGFVIVRAAMKENWRTFLKLRALRIYPIYWIYLLPSIAFVAIWQQEAVSAARLASSALLYASQTPQIMPVAWSLVYEVYFYAVIAIVVALRANLWLSMVVWAAATIAVGTIAHESPLLAMAGHPFVLQFIAGGLLNYATTSLSVGRWSILGMVALCLVGNAAAFTMAPGHWTAALLIGTPYALLVLGLTRLTTVSAPTWLVRLGDASYSLYLSHFLLIAALSRMLFKAIPDFAAWAPALACALIITANVWAILSYRLLERPILAVSKTWRAPRVGSVAREQAKQVHPPG